MPNNEPDAPNVQAFLSRYSDALDSSLQVPEDQEGRWREIFLLGEVDTKFVDDPRGSSKLLATCSIEQNTQEN